MDYSRCELCAHRCGVDRTAGETGVCGCTSELRLSRAALHFWEEPPISGTRGSGTVFFTGCSLGCIYCQNAEISKGLSGKNVSTERLTEIFFELRDRGAHNVNLVTPTHYVPTIIDAVRAARKKGFSLPVVYNTASYETVETVESLRGTVDVYLADLKYLDRKTAKEYSHAEDYPEVAAAAIAEMVKQQPKPVYGEDGMLKQGVIVRVLLLPMHVSHAKLIVKHLYETYGDSIIISLMNQYTPPQGMPRPLDRTVTRAEYRELCEFADKIGVKNAFVQEEGTQKESFIPSFDNTGI